MNYFSLLPYIYFRVSSVNLVLCQGYHSVDEFLYCRLLCFGHVLRS